VWILNKNEVKAMKRVQGFTLIEVLGALLVLSTLMLGVAKAYLWVMYETQQLTLKNQVLMIIKELVHRQQRNTTQAYFVQTYWSEISSRSPYDCAVQQSCTSQQLRDFDIAWARTALTPLTSQAQTQIQPCSQRERLCLEVSVPNLVTGATSASSAVPKVAWQFSVGPLS